MIITLFYPIGFLAPFTIRAKVLMQFPYAYNLFTYLIYLVRYVIHLFHLCNLSPHVY